MLIPVSNWEERGHHHTGAVLKVLKKYRADHIASLLKPLVCCWHTPCSSTNAPCSALHNELKSSLHVALVCECSLYLSQPAPCLLEILLPLQLVAKSSWKLLSGVFAACLFALFHVNAPRLRIFPGWQQL